MTAADAGLAVDAGVRDSGTHDGGTHDAGLLVSRMTAPGAVLLTDFAEADSDEDRPGRPAVAAGADRFLVVVPRMVRASKSSSLVGALVTPDRIVQKELTLLDELDEPIGVDLALRTCRERAGGARVRPLPCRKLQPAAPDTAR